MNIRLVLERLLSQFAAAHIQYALMGGFALGAWGVPRATMDIDFLVRREDSDGIDRIMRDLEYECRYRSENVSQYVSPLKIYGQVDFLHAFRKASLAMLERAEPRSVFENAMRLPVLRPEDIVGLKVQAMKNDTQRAARDRDDILRLLAVCRDRVDWLTVEEYFSLFEMQETWNELRKELGR